MHSVASQAFDPSAMLLAIVVSANGRIDAREVAELERLQAFDRLGVRRDRFLDVAESALEEFGAPLSQTQGMRLSDRSLMIALQLAVGGPEHRLLVCRLSAAVITADGRVTGDERQVYASLLGHLGVTQTMRGTRRHAGSPALREEFHDDSDAGPVGPVRREFESPHSSKIPVDFMVESGQGQSRSWELALGGITRTPLGTMALPALTLH